MPGHSPARQSRLKVRVRIGTVLRPPRGVPSSVASQIV